MFTNTQSLSFCVFSDSWTHSFHSLLLYSFILCLLYLIIAHTPFCVCNTHTHTHTLVRWFPLPLSVCMLSLSLFFLSTLCIPTEQIISTKVCLYFLSESVLSFNNWLFSVFAVVAKNNFLYFLFYILCWNNFRLAI